MRILGNLGISWDFVCKPLQNNTKHSSHTLLCSSFVLVSSKTLSPFSSLFGVWVSG